MLMAFICYAIGVIASLYVGGWMMLILPVHDLYVAYRQGGLNVLLITISVVKILLSSTVAGFIWCLGYILYNRFRDSAKGDLEDDLKKESESKIL